MENVLKFLKDNVKATLTVVVLGFAVTFGWAKGCTVVPTAPAPVPAGQPAPVAP